MRLSFLQNNTAMNSYLSSANSRREIAPAAEEKELSDERTMQEKEETDVFIRSKPEEAGSISLRPVWRELSVYNHLTEMLRNMGAPLEDMGEENTEEKASA